MATFCTDAGHGGSDSGASWQNVLEKDLNLQYTLALNSELKARGHRVLTTRRDDITVPPLGTRCRLINSHHNQKAPQFKAIISLHCNVAAVLDSDTGMYRPISTRKGLYCIYSEASARGKGLARSLAAACEKAGITLSHGGMISTVQLGRALAWIHKTTPPAVLLELGFMTNPDELALLQDEAYRGKMVATIADGIEAYI